MYDYRSLQLCFGDLHNHCAISYGHGDLPTALENASTQLDFCSVTGHASWPDMPETDERIGYIVDFHNKGFARLQKCWQDCLAIYRRYNCERKFVVFPGYEIHSSAHGDYTVVYRDIAATPILANNISAVKTLLANSGLQALVFPHHLAYPQGSRGINWQSFSSQMTPVVEIVSMHGCSENCDGPRPFYHTMGASDWQSTVNYGLSQGHCFGFIGNTDHHSAYPGSYGHGKTAVWSQSLTRSAIWHALEERRCYALTGDNIEMCFSMDNRPMGAVYQNSDKRHGKIEIIAGAAIDYVDVIKNNRLFKRFLQIDQAQPVSVPSHSKLFFEVGWGERHKTTYWEVELHLDAGEIYAVEPRFRGLEIVSPVEKDYSITVPLRNGKWRQLDARSLFFSVVSQGNPTNSTPATQGICLDIDTNATTLCTAIVNGIRYQIPLSRLQQGALARNLGTIDSLAFRFHRLPEFSELSWSMEFHDSPETACDYYYVRVRQKNDQWAWSSPIWIVS